MASPALRLIPGGAFDANVEPASRVEAVLHEAVSPEAVSPEAVSPEAVSPEAVSPEAVSPEAASPEAASLAAEVHDADLVQRLLAGEQAALEQLYRRHASFAFNLAVRLQGHANEVEDVVHDSFIKAHAELAGLRDAGAFRSWLGSIVVNQVRMRIRRGSLLRGLRLASPESVDLESIASPTASPDVRAQLAQVYALLKLLPADERITWTLRCVERHRLEEVAVLVGCSLATVKRRLARAQGFLDDHFVEPGRSFLQGDES
jgi:RNA polymerase sigma-70 factor, ECF subfamily